jgi:hypothetical protein
MASCCRRLHLPYTASDLPRRSSVRPYLAEACVCLQWLAAPSSARATAARKKETRPRLPGLPKRPYCLLVKPYTGPVSRVIIALQHIKKPFQKIVTVLCLSLKSMASWESSRIAHFAVNTLREAIRRSAAVGQPPRPGCTLRCQLSKDLHCCCCCPGKKKMSRWRKFGLNWPHRPHRASCLAFCWCKEIWGYVAFGFLFWTLPALPLGLAACRLPLLGDSCPMFAACRLPLLAAWLAACSLRRRWNNLWNDLWDHSQVGPLFLQHSLPPAWSPLAPALMSNWHLH